MNLPVYVINLDSYQCRWESSNKQLDDLNVECTRISAIDGNDLSNDYVDAFNKRNALMYKWLRPLSASEIGCFLSHVYAWEEIVNNDRQGGFIFEDDFIANNDLPIVIDAIEKLKIKYPVLIKLYVPNSSEKWGYNSGCARSVSVVDNYCLTLPLKVQWGALAYYINKDAAVQLIKNSKQCKRPLDDYLRRTWEAGVLVLHITPSLIKHNNNNASIIGVSRKVMQSIHNTFLYRAIYNLEFRVMNAIHLPFVLFKARKIFESIQPNV